MAGHVRSRNQALIYSSPYDLVKKKSYCCGAGISDVWKNRVTVHLELFLLLKFINFLDTGRWLSETRVIWEIFWESENCTVYSTVKPCFVKFLSCLCFKLADLAKHLGECFIVASSRSSLAVGYLVGRLCLIVASCERLEGEGVMWADTHCSDSLQLAQGKSPREAGQKHFFFFLYEKRDMHFLS